jgi:conjugal transfer pilus assembly protein TraF
VLIAFFTFIALTQLPITPHSSLITHALAEQRYFDKHKEGWFWYKEKREREKEVKREKDKEEKRKEPESPTLTVEDIRKKGEELFNRAVLDPTPENVLAYMRFQKLILDRSKHFAEVWRTVLWENPELDETVKNPASTLGIQLAGEERKKSIREVIGKIREIGKLVFFFTSTCPYCKEEGRLLKVFSENYGLGVMAVSLDGGGLEEWKDYVLDNGQARNLGVSEVPTLFLLIPPDKVIRIGTGLLTYDELERRLYIVGKEVLGIKETYPSNEEFIKYIKTDLEEE